MSLLFTEEELRRVQEAVAAAEQQTAGEIVPVIVPRSGTYPEAVWKGAVLLMLPVLVVASMFDVIYQGWGLTLLHTGWGVALLTALAGIIGGLLGAYVAPVQRWLVGADRMAEQVHLRALQAFVEEEVFNTRDRTGILIFVSLFEHWVEVIGDAGIHRQVGPEAWAEIVNRIREGIRAGRPVDGLVAAIEQCGQLLAAHGVAIRPDDTNELADTLRVRGQQRRKGRRGRRRRR
ncbi:MAG: hypothetical protein Q9M35_05545 [Rhodothermus sp.]|nr:hypothetical protein [Rhodothermus sp.]